MTSIDLSGDTFLDHLIDVASSRAITAAAHTFHNFLFSDLATSKAKAISKAERKERDISDASFVYGEIDFHSFAQILREIRPLVKRDGLFFDLGSGTGRPCFAMALLSDMHRIVGVEALEQLVQASRDVLAKYEAFVESDEVEVEEEGEEENEQEEEQPHDADAHDSPTRAARPKRIVHSPLAKLERRASLPNSARVSFVHANLLDIDWSDGDFVFLNSTCYSASLMAGVSEAAAKLKPGSIVVSLTKPINSPHFTILSKKKYPMSWGSSTVFVARRN